MARGAVRLRALDEMIRVPDFGSHRGRINKVALRYYMDMFDFSNLRLDIAFRSVQMQIIFPPWLTCLN
jgi:Sec7-like guanine-nucleotide exchange factor